MHLARPRPHLARLSIAVGALAVLIASCTHLGEVHASYPRVFSSQRLVQHRLKEAQWLEKKLDEPVEHGFRSITDRRRREQLVVQGSVAAGADALLQDLDDAGLSPSAASASLPNPGDAVTTTAQLDPIELLEDERTYRDRVRLMMRDLMLDDVHDANGNTLYQLNFDLTMVPAGDRPDPAIAAFQIDRVEPAAFSDDELEAAFRRAIDQIEREMRSQLAEFKLRLQQRSPSETREAVAWEAARVLQQQAMAERAHLDHLQTFALLGDEELAENAGEIHGFMTVEAATPRIGLTMLVAASRAALEETESVIAEVEAWRSVEADAGVETSLSTAAQRELELAFLRFGNGGHPPWIEFERPRRNAAPNPRPLHGKEQLQKFRDAVRDEVANVVREPGAVVLMDSPTEYAQNHSDVSALSDLLQISMKASASEGTTKGSGSFDRLQETQTLLQTIKRAPLLLAYGRGRSHFGWVMGPSYSIDDFQPRFDHKPVHHSVSAQIVVPRFAGKVYLKAGYAWAHGADLLNARGGSVTGSLDDVDGLSEIWGPGCSCIELPTDIELRRFARNGSDREPIITTFDGGIVEGRANQKLVILGRNLWRNPRVYVGGRPADHVEILPDMAGVEATFTTFAPVAGGTFRPSAVPLRVSTSHGTATSTVDIPIHRNPGVPHFASMTATDQTIVAKGTVKITYDPALLPSHFHALYLTLRRHGKPGWSVIDGLPRIDPKRSELTFEVGSIPSNALWGKFDAADFDVGLMLQRSPMEDAKRVEGASGPVLGSVLVFQSKTATAATVSSPRPATLQLDASGTPTTPLKLAIGPFVQRVHKGLSTGTAVTIEAKDSAGRTASMKAAWGSAGIEVPAAPLKGLVGTFQNGAKLSLTVSYGSGKGAKTLAVSTTVTIKR